MNTSSPKNSNKKSNLKDFLPQNSIIISNHLSLKKRLKDFEIFSIQEFCEFILRKSPLLFYPQTLSDSLGIFIINTLISELFKRNSALYSLTKSTFFAKELYRVFGELLEAEILPNELFNLIQEIELKDEDNIRFKLIIDVYKNYLIELEKLDYIDKRNLCRYTKNVLQENPSYLTKVQNDFPNIIVDISQEEPPTQKLLFKTINTKRLDLQTQNEISNLFATKLAQKYLQKTPKKIEDTSSTCHLLKFIDIRDEALYIAKEIIEKTKSNNLKYEDFTIVLSNSNTIKIFSDIFLNANIPTNISTLNKDYQRFLIKLTQYLNICNAQKEISEKHHLKADCDRIWDEINMNFENIISETLENQFIKDKFLSIQLNSKEKSLLKCTEDNLNILNINDAKKITAELNNINQLKQLYQEGKITEFAAFVAQTYKNKSTEFQKNLATFLNQINTTEKLSVKLKGKPPEINEILNIINLKTSKLSKDSIGVNIVSFFTSENIDCKEIYIPDLTEKTIPNKTTSTQFLSQEAINKISLAFKNKFNYSKPLIQNEKELIEQSAQNLVSAIFSAQHHVTLSTHRYEDKKQIAPSIFFQYLESQFPQYVVEPQKNKENNSKQELQNANFPSDTNELVISDSEIIKLSSSSISNFQSCPRKYYFNNLLGLKETTSYAANYGTIVHTIMEIFNRKYLTSYSKETLLELSNILFNSNYNPQAAISAGFDKKDIERINATDLLSLEEMKTQFESAIKSLEKQDFFKNIPDEIISEKSFSFTIDKLPNIIFSGRIDAIYRFKDQYEIVDFKTGKNKPLLDYLISENGVTFKTPKGASTNEEKKQNEYEYQIPIYYLACQNAQELSEFKNKISTLGLLYIRPENKEKGYKKDTIEKEKLEEYLDKIIENLDNTVIKKIKQQNYFQPKYNEMICTNCSFKYLCDIEDNGEEEND